jgi:hypothetical protein
MKMRGTGSTASADRGPAGRGLMSGGCRHSRSAVRGVGPPQATGLLRLAVLFRAEPDGPEQAGRRASPDYSHPCRQLRAGVLLASRLGASAVRSGRRPLCFRSRRRPPPYPRRCSAHRPASRWPAPRRRSYPDGTTGAAGRMARLTASRWSRCGQLADSRTITRRARVITSAATLINRVRQVQANPSPSGSRRRRRLKNRLRSGSSIAAVGNSAGRPSSALVGGAWTTARRSRTSRFNAKA